MASSVPNDAGNIDIKSKALQFYASKETLKESVDQYNFLNTTDFSGIGWCEQCATCKKPMDRLNFFSPELKLEGIPESISGLQADKKKHVEFFQLWVKEPVVNPMAEHWFCQSCGGVWVIIDGYFWTRVRINGMDTLNPTLVQRISDRPPVVPLVEEVDPGPQPFPEATQCPNCKIWRMIEPYSETHVQHVCLKCRAVGLYKITAI